MSRWVNVLRAVPVAAGVVVAGMWVRVATAQAAPDATQPAGTPNAANNNWWDVPVPAAPSTGPSQPMFRHQGSGSSPYSTNITDYPSAQMGDWVVANAMAARARSMLLRAQSELDQTIRRVTQRFEHSDDYAKAVLSERQAYSEYVATRQKALASLSNDPKYHAIMQLRDELGEKILARRGAREEETDIDTWLKIRGFERSKLTGDQMISLKALYDSEQQKAGAADIDAAVRGEILALATLKMQYASDARDIEVSALSTNDDLKNARAKMMDASKRLSELKAQFDYNLRDNPEVLMARRNLEDARVSVVETQALAASASAASDYALNYAYYLHRNDNGGVNGPYGANLAGYTSPYWGR